MQFFWRWLFKIMGWKIVGAVPQEKKFVLIVAPHTSNWDLIIGLIAKFSIGKRYNFLVKHQAFAFPLGLLLKRLGAVPINRDTTQNFVDFAASLFSQQSEFVLGIAPEGTRKAVTRWKTGFYHIACKAKVPILMAGLDYGKKNVVLKKFMPTGNQSEDFKAIFDFYRHIQGRYPKKIPTDNQGN